MCMNRLSFLLQMAHDQPAAIHGYSRTCNSYRKAFRFYKMGPGKTISERWKDRVVHAHGTRANSNVIWASRKLGLPLFIQYTDGLFMTINIFAEEAAHYGWEISDWKNVCEYFSFPRNQNSARKYFPGFKSVDNNYGINQQNSTPTDLWIIYARNWEYLIMLSLFCSWRALPCRNSHWQWSKHSAKPLPKIHPLDYWWWAMANWNKPLTSWSNKQDKGKSLPAVVQAGCADVQAAADIYALPSLWEGLPIGLLEAMAMGRQLLQAKWMALLKWSRTMKTVIDLSENMESELTRSILQFAANAGLRKRLGDKARALSAPRFSAPFMTRQVEDIYRKLLPGA